MRLALVTHNILKGDGQGRVNYEIARYALERGAEVTLLADRIDASLSEMGAQWIPIRCRFRDINLIKVLEFARKSSVRLRSFESTHIIHGSGYTLDCPHHVNNCQFVHGSWLRSPVHVARLLHGTRAAYQRFYSRRNATDELRVFRRARVVVASSQLIREQLVSIGVPTERIQVILNGVDLQEFCPGPASRKALGLPEGVPLAVFVGDIRTPRKNLDTVLRALIEVPGLHLAIAGSTEGSPFLQLVDQLGISSRVHFLGFRKDVAQIMRAVDLFVFPSRYEACALVLLEALASGLPVVTARTAGGAEVVTPDCGWVVQDPDDCKSVAAALRALTESPELRRCMGQSARTAAEQLSWHSMARAHFALYESFGS